jgi:hypothetical protein
VNLGHRKPKLLFAVFFLHNFRYLISQKLQIQEKILFNIKLSLVLMLKFRQRLYRIGEIAVAVFQISRRRGNIAMSGKSPYFLDVIVRRF